MDDEDNLVTACAACNIGRNLDGYIPLDRTLTSKPPRTPRTPRVLGLIIEYLGSNPMSSATTIAPAIGIARTTVSKTLAGNPGIFAYRRFGHSILYALRETSE
jgi:hypothetical protein